MDKTNKKVSKEKLKFSDLNILKDHKYGEHSKTLIIVWLLSMITTGILSETSQIYSPFDIVCIIVSTVTGFGLLGLMGYWVFRVKKIKIPIPFPFADLIVQIIIFAPLTLYIILMPAFPEIGVHYANYSDDKISFKIPNT